MGRVRGNPGKSLRRHDRPAHDDRRLLRSRHHQLLHSRAIEWSQDQFGRQLILHGLNTSSSAKGEPLRNPWIAESDVEREATEYGFNVVRYLIFWDAIEPQKDQFDQAYIDRIETRVNWYTSRRMYVLLDMHQAAPLELPGGTPWWLKNIDPTVVNSWINFWQYTNHKDLQDHYILAWQKIAERFKDNPYVIGYD